ncbi:hypothetical protein DICSQDRAFT_22750, partial [Dichomitus squalens LYAD-421 SS1]
GVFDVEYLWRNHRSWLADPGYMLRPRYRLNWELVRLGTQRTRLHCEYGQSPLVGD